MASSDGFIQFVMDQVPKAGNIRYKKMFGEYMVFLDEKPVLLICDDTVFVKMLPPVLAKFEEYGAPPETGFPYKGAREHYILDIENTDLSIEIMQILARLYIAPKPKKSKIN